MERIIPAYAGSTYRIGLSGGASQDHPRIRGEHACGASVKGTLSGSSPHTRGALGRTAGSGFRRRIIPAYAGSTAAGSLCRGRLTDHPRIRGEHVKSEVRSSGDIGSSPHTRGAQADGHRRTAAERIIPAYAGSTRVGRRPCRRSGDHPRIRGEHYGQFRRVAARPGSSPHTRGAHARHGEIQVGGRIIPAYAGSTGGRSGCSPWREDHPRIRGEHGVI